MVLGERSHGEGAQSVTYILDFEADPGAGVFNNPNNSYIEHIQAVVDRSHPRPRPKLVVGCATVFVYNEWLYGQHHPTETTPHEMAKLKSAYKQALKGNTRVLRRVVFDLSRQYLAGSEGDIDVMAQGNALKRLARLLPEVTAHL